MKDKPLLTTQFLTTLNNHYPVSGRIVLALSGGLDSITLLHLLTNYKILHTGVECLAVHVHHGLSGNADYWAQQCKIWCDRYGIECKVERVHLRLANQISTEQEARQKRYCALKKHINDGDLLLTGQHSSDQMETFLLALKRGSGPKGLSSMAHYAKFGKGHLLRPLLNISRDEILEYATDNSLNWVEDETNQDTQYDRNFLRHTVIPVIKARWPGIEQSVLRTSQLCADQEQLIRELLFERLNKLVDADESIAISGLNKQSASARRQLLRLWLDAQHSLMPSAKQLELIWNEVALARKDANPKLKIASGEIRRYKDRLYFVAHLSDVTKWSATLELDHPVELPDGLGCITLCRSPLATKAQLIAPRPGEKVWLHFNPQGLSAHPTGREQSRKLKKLFQEYQVPVWMRRRTPIIMYGDRLVAVADLFVCKEFNGDDCAIKWDKVHSE